MTRRRTLFSFNGDANSATVVDPDAGKLVTDIPLGGKPEYGVSAGDGNVYVNLTDKAEIVEIDARTLTVTRRWPTTGCKNPVAMAIDTQHQRLFSGCRSGVMAVSDYRTGKVVATAEDCRSCSLRLLARRQRPLSTRHRRARLCSPSRDGSNQQLRKKGHVLARRR